MNERPMSDAERAQFDEQQRAAESREEAEREQGLVKDETGNAAGGPVGSQEGENGAGGTAGEGGAEHADGGAGEEVEHHE